MKITKVILILISVNTLLYSQSILDKKNVDSLNRNSCVELSVKINEIVVINQNLKNLLEDESYFDVFDSLSDVDPIVILDNDVSAQNLKTKYETLKRVCYASRNFNEHRLSQKIEKLLLQLVDVCPELLLNDLMAKNNPKIIDATSLKKFLEEYSFYLFSMNLNQNSTLNSIDEILKISLSKVVYLPALKKEIENVESYKIVVTEGAKFIKMAIFDSQILYFFNYRIPDSVRQKSSIDTVCIFDYYPLHQWKEPVFITYMINPEDALGLLYYNNLNRILE